MSLGLVIPVCNDLAGLRTVLGQAGDLGIFDQVVVVDDASDQPLTPEAIAGDDGTGADLNLSLLQQPRRCGAGAARNRGLAEIRTDYVLFFDADDHLRPELGDLWQDLQTQDLPFDFCMFHHIEERRRQEDHWGMFPKDEDLWRQAGAQHPMAVLEDPEALATLVQVAAYPWNKIYRTAFLRAHQISCSETVVHNDIALHWRGFLAAKRVICAPLLGCEHILGQTRDHITHKKGAERLQLFHALGDVQVALAGEDPQPWRLAFARFYIDLITWAQARVDPAFRAAFDQQARRFLMADLDPELFQTLNHQFPDLARQALDLMQDRG